MAVLNILQAEFLKTKRSALRRIALTSPLVLAILALIQQGFFSLNLFNWYYVAFLPATFALISGIAVNIDSGKRGMRAICCLPIRQEKIWLAKLTIASSYAFCSCLLLSIAVVFVPEILSLLGAEQVKPLNIGMIATGILVMFFTTLWQIPFCFILAKKLGLVFTAVMNLLVSVSGVLLALEPFWFLCPWAWVNRCMVSIVGVLPNGLPVEQVNYSEPENVLSALVLSLILTTILIFLATKIFAKSEAR